ncbi:MAG TPA: Ku protein [Gaiellaceae bacterium]|nr:Ku protein [Gaiellaceae bacterium]
MPRSIWTGSISFGLVNVPVRMYSAISESDLRFHLLHEPDGGRIGYQKICKAEGDPVPDEEIVKAFEFEKDEFVVLTDEDFAAAKTEGVKTIEISDFVPYDEIDPIYFEKTYFLGPQSGGEKVYALLRDAMEHTGLAAIGKFVMRDRQHLGCLRVREGTITLEKMFFHDEVRPIDEIAPEGVEVGANELEMATALIEQFTGTFEPAKYEDTYREALCGVIRAKRKGQSVTVAKPEAEEEPTDLLAALRASVEAAKRSRGDTTPAKRAPARKPAAKKASPKQKAAKQKAPAKKAAAKR